MAEFGLIGSLLLLGVIITAGYILVREFQSCRGDSKKLAGAIIAGLASLAVQSLFEDYLYHYVVIVFGCILIALLASLTKTKIERFENTKLLWLLPIFVFIGWIYTWSAIPQHHLGEALSLIDEEGGGWKLAAETVDQALAESPESHLYITQSAFFWYNAWVETGDIQALQIGNDRFSQSLRSESGLSWVWANKAMTSWYQGKYDQALIEVERAIDLANSEPTYYLNKGWFLEQKGETSLAKSTYILALRNSEYLDWYTHPFWTLSKVRREALEEWRAEKNASYEKNAFDDFITAYQDGNYLEAEKFFLRQKWVRLSGLDPDLLMMQGYLLLENGDIESAVERFKDAYHYTFYPQRLSTLGFWTVEPYKAIGLYDTFVPGVLHLSGDVGQFKYFDDIITRLNSLGVPNEELCELYEEHSRAMTGGEIMISHVNFPESCKSNSWNRFP